MKNRNKGKRVCMWNEVKSLRMRTEKKGYRKIKPHDKNRVKNCSMEYGWESQGGIRSWKIDKIILMEKKRNTKSRVNGWITKSKKIMTTTKN